MEVLPLRSITSKDTATASRVLLAPPGSGFLSGAGRCHDRMCSRLSSYPTLREHSVAYAKPRRITRMGDWPGVLGSSLVDPSPLQIPYKTIASGRLEPLIQPHYER